MKIQFRKQTENYELATFDEYQLIEDLEYCCYRFHILDSESSLWNKKSGKFCLICVNSQGEPIYYPIDFCPFCGERFDYEEIKD